MKINIYLKSSIEKEVKINLVIKVTPVCSLPDSVKEFSRHGNWSKNGKAVEHRSESEKWW